MPRSKASQKGETVGESSKVTKQNVNVTRPRISSLASHIATLKVGPNAKTFVIHENLLVACSPYFRKAFRGDFKKAKNCEVVLDDVHERTFGIFIEWIYTQNLCKPEFVRDAHDIIYRATTTVPKSSSDRDSGGNGITTTTLIAFTDFDEATLAIYNSKPSHHNFLRGKFTAYDLFDPAFWNWDDLLDLAIFSDKYNVLHLYTDIIKQWISQTCAQPADENLPEDSTLCKLISHIFGHIWEPSEPSSDQADMYDVETALFIRQHSPRSFLAETLLFKACILAFKNSPKRFGSSPPPLWQTDPCQFHAHMHDEELDACKKAFQREKKEELKGEATRNEWYRASFPRPE